jgi:hypothetical protein
MREAKIIEDTVVFVSRNRTGKPEGRDSFPVVLPRGYTVRQT